MYKKRIDGAYQDVIYGRTYMHVWVGGLVLHVGSPPSPLPLPFSVSFSTQYAISFPLNPPLSIYTYSPPFPSTSYAHTCMHVFVERADVWGQEIC